MDAVVREIGPSETALAYEVYREFRARTGSREEFLARIDAVQRREGFRLVGVIVDGQAVAVAGFREGHNTAWGHYLYVDDLTTLASHRRHGYASALVDWLIAEAKRLDCDELHLDSGATPARDDAHRLYLHRRFAIRAFHFALPLRPSPGPPVAGSATQGLR
jgi:GNAT superfamily N-acetyltransferase